MNDEHEYEFETLGKQVTVRTNSHGSFLYVEFDGVVIEDSTGSCMDWDFTGHLHGAALKANENAQLRRAAEMSLAAALRNIPDLYAEIEDAA